MADRTLAEGAVALVTGANKGLGKEVARQLGRAGLCVHVGSRDPDRGAAAVAELRAEGLDARPLLLDVTSDASVAAAAAALERLDVLVNNAGILIPRPVLETEIEDVVRTFDTNLFGVVRVTRALLPLLQASRHPRIVNVSSATASLALISDPALTPSWKNHVLAYASSKAALSMVTVQYANAFRNSPPHAHIKINAATPGHIATDLNQHRAGRSAAEGARVIVELATLDDDGPTGGFFNDAGPVAW